MSARIHVLYVDDEEDIRTVVEMALALDPGIECRTASSAKAALAIIAEGWRPEIALLDMMMPITGGRELLAELRRNATTTDMPVVLVTAGTVDPETLAGIAGVIAKPFDPLALAGRVRAILTSSGNQIV